MYCIARACVNVAVVSVAVVSVVSLLRPVSNVGRSGFSFIYGCFEIQSARFFTTATALPKTLSFTSCKHRANISNISIVIPYTLQAEPERIQFPLIGMPYATLLSQVMIHTASLAGVVTHSDLARLECAGNEAGFHQVGGKHVAGFAIVDEEVTSAVLERNEPEGAVELA